MTRILSYLIVSKTFQYTLLFIISLTFRIILGIYYNPHHIAPDGTGYYRIAVNLEKGNGYSISEKAPYELFFLREPGYPYFLAIGLNIFNFLGGDVEYLKAYNIETRTISEIPGSIKFIRIWQAFFDSLSVLIFFSLLKLVLRQRYALTIAGVLSIYSTIGIYCTNILRGSFTLFLSLCFSYFLARFINGRKSKDLIIFSVFGGICILTFQVYKAIPFILFIFMIIYTKRFYYSLKTTIISGCIMLFITLPWVYNVYNYYPDIRVIKTFGSSFTHELRNYNIAQFKDMYYNSLDRSSIDFEWNKPSKIQFERSFNGFYKMRTDSLNKLTNENIISKRKVKNAFSAARKTIFFNSIAPFKRKAIKNYPVYTSLMILSMFVIGILFIIGFVQFYKKAYIVLFFFYFHILFFFLLGDEYRRSLPAQPFFLMFSILAIFFIYFRFIKKNKTKDAIEGILNQDYSSKFKSNYKEHKQT